MLVGRSREEESAPIPLPDLRTARRILCVQPHYDDNDIGAGGTISALAEAGAAVTYLTVTDDLVGVLDASLSDAEAREQLRREQAQAAAEIGVGEQIWLDYPDAGPYDCFELRTRIVAEIRRLRPDFVFSVDPWLPREAHGDHLRVGMACAEAVLLQGLPRLRSDPAIDADYEPYELQALVCYFTAEPNLIFDIGPTWERKRRALGAYRAQFSAEALDALCRGLEAKQREWAADEPFRHGEALKLLRPAQLHVDLSTR